MPASGRACTSALPTYRRRFSAGRWSTTWRSTTSSRSNDIDDGHHSKPTRKSKRANNNPASTKITTSQLKNPANRRGKAKKGTAMNFLAQFTRRYKQFGRSVSVSTKTLGAKTRIEHEKVARGPAPLP